MTLPTDNSEAGSATTPPPAGRAAHGPKTVSAFVPRITEKAFAKHGFAAATLITDWPVIVGEEFARTTRPERLKWPRPPGDALAASEEGRGRPGATLTLAVDAAAALDIQYRTDQIIERVNGYFGYAAITGVKLRQVATGFDEPEAQARPARDERKAAAPPPVASSAADDDPLQDALLRLGRSIASSTG
ncbi:MAG: DUF721 domain-containing protein [Hyphomicrobiaceae bacterium]